MQWFKLVLKPVMTVISMMTMSAPVNVFGLVVVMASSVLGSRPAMMAMKWMRTRVRINVARLVAVMASSKMAKPATMEILTIMMTVEITVRSHPAVMRWFLSVSKNVTTGIESKTINAPTNVASLDVAMVCFQPANLAMMVMKSTTTSVETIVRCRSVVMA